LEKIHDQQIRTESKTQLVEQINGCLRSGDNSRALDLLRSIASDFPGDTELAELEKRAQDGVSRNAEATRLITKSQELFANRKSDEAIQLLREAHNLDKNNALARAILANALVEHAHSLVETDWLKAETLTNQALALNPVHPTAKTILSLIVTKKETSSMEDWVSQARKLQSAGDLFAALAWVAEGLAVHPHDPKLLQIQDEIQRDQDARRRQARRGDLEDLRRMQREIDGATDVAAKQALATRIQTVAAKHWTDGEILSIANALLLRLGLISQESSGTSPRSKGSTVILHVPRPSAPKSPESSQIPPSKVVSSEVAPSPVPPVPVLPTPVATKQVTPSMASPTQIEVKEAAPSPVVSSPVAPSPMPSSAVAPTAIPANPNPPGNVPTSVVTPSQTPLRTPLRGKLRSTQPKAQKLSSLEAAAVSAAEPSAPAATVSTPARQVTRSKSTTLIAVSAVAIVLIAAAFFFVGRHYAPPAATSPAAAPGISAPTASTPTGSAPVASSPAVSPAPSVTAPIIPAPAHATPEPSQPELPVSSNTAAGNGTPKVTPNDQPADSAHKVGTLLIAAGQDGASVFLNGKLQPQLTQAGQLRLPSLEPRGYVVQVSKTGFQDPPPQKIRIRKGEEAKLVFNLRPQPSLASLTIQGGNPGTTVLVDQTPVGTIQPDGTLSVSTVNPGNHTVELRKDRFKPRQLKKLFVAGQTISLAAADTALEAALAELKITFTPPDAKVAISKGEIPTMVSSGVPLNVAPGTYTLTARMADRYTRFATFEAIAGQSKTLNLSLAPNGMSKWDDPGAWKQEGDSFIHKGGGFVLYGVVPASGNFAFSATLIKGHLLQWVVNYTDAKNYVLFQMDDSNFSRTVIRNGQKTNETKVPNKGDKKHLRALHIRVSSTEIVHQIPNGDVWTVVDRWTEPGANLSQGKFGFYLPGDDQVALSGFTHYADLNIR
jgi:tetratricopeptide (TPR) repeat protein